MDPHVDYRSAFCSPQCGGHAGTWRRSSPSAGRRPPRFRGPREPDRQRRSGQRDVPGTGDTLPLQVIARLADTENGAAGSAAAQFADPQTAEGPEPGGIRHQSRAEQPRPGHLLHRAGQHRGAARRAAAAGGRWPRRRGTDRASCSGRLFIDGVLAVFAVQDVTDLTGVTIDMHVTIVKEVQGQAEPSRFSRARSVDRPAGTNRAVDFAVEGGFPTSGIWTPTLPPWTRELGVFHVVILPNLIVDYPFAARVGQPFALRAKIAVEATTGPAAPAWPPSWARRSTRSRRSSRDAEPGRGPEDDRRPSAGAGRADREGDLPRPTR